VKPGGVGGGKGECVGIRRGDVVCCGFVGQRLQGSAGRLCRCRKSQDYGED